ncbi:hypothetical protein PTKIN_Ptkin17bG0094300 [Pterospermum kingtungense]
MGESSCVVKSFSNPGDISHEPKQGEPIRALTESVSVGRFISESLAWEKWSTFSNNRYMEEVEKFSELGSFAQKRSFFEAHFKRRAATRAAALLEHANTVTNHAPPMGTINADVADSSLNTGSAIADASLAMNQQDKGVSDAEVADIALVDVGNLNTDEESGQEVKEKNVNIENSSQVENSKALDNIDNHGMIMATPDKKIPHKEFIDQKNTTSSSKKRQTNSLSKSSTPSKASRFPLHPSKRMASAQYRSDNGVARFKGNINDKKKTVPNSLHVSMTFASGASKTSKTLLRMPGDSSTSLQMPTRTLNKAADQENLAPSSEKRRSNSMSKLSNHVEASKQEPSRIGNNHAHIHKKSTVDSTEQRTLQKSLQMLMNFTPHAGETDKTSPKVSRESSTPLQTPTRASFNWGSKLASKVPQSQDKRTTAVQRMSVSGEVTGDGRWEMALSFQVRAFAT